MGTKSIYIFPWENVLKFRSGHGTHLACQIPTWQANAGESQAIGSLVPTRPPRCGPTRARAGHKQEERKLKMHTKQRHAEPIAPATARLERGHSSLWHPTNNCSTASSCTSYRSYLYLRVPNLKGAGEACPGMRWRSAVSFSSCLGEAPHKCQC